jgi:hypothetical protein
MTDDRRPIAKFFEALGIKDFWMFSVDMVMFQIMVE